MTTQVRCRACEQFMTTDKFLDHQCIPLADPKKRARTRFADWSAPGADGILEMEAMLAGALFSTARTAHRLDAPTDRPTVILQVLVADLDKLEVIRARVLSHPLAGDSNVIVQNMAPDEITISNEREPKGLIERLRALIFGTKFWTHERYRMPPAKDLGMYIPGATVNAPAMTHRDAQRPLNAFVTETGEK